MLEAIWQDVRHGARMLAMNPGFTLTAVVSIALGVGANAAMFSVADAMVLRPLQVSRPDEIVAVSATTPQDGAGLSRNRAVSYRDYVDLRDRTRSFAGLIAYRVLITSVADRPDEPAQSRLSLAVSGNFFDVLGLQPALGRMFVRDEDRVPGRDAVLVLAHDTWTEQFGSDPGILGRRLRAGGVDFTVIGVAPAGFPGMDLVLHPAFYVPLAISSSLAGSQPDSLDRRDVRSLTVKGRLKPGVGLEQAQQEADLLAKSLEQTHPDTNRNFGFLVRSDLDDRIEARGPSAPAAFMLMALAFVVLLVACANVAGLLMSRAPARAREIALRLAIGGSRFRVSRQLITESFLLAIGGGGLGLAIGYAAIGFFNQLRVVSDIGVRFTYQLDERVLMIGLVMTAASALLSGLVPAWRATRAADLARPLKLAVSSDPPHVRLWGRNGLVAGQVALSLMLLTVAVSLYRAFQAEFGRPGFRTERILLMNFEPRLARYDEPRTEAFYRALKERAQTLRGVSSVGMTSVLPMNQDYRERSAIVPEGHEFPPGTDSVTVWSARIDEGYLDTMGIPVTTGRGFGPTDTADAPRVAIVNQSLAARYWAGENPLGKRIQLRDRSGAWVEIVGVTADSKYNWIGEAPTAFLYLPLLQDSAPRATLLVASNGNAAASASPLRQIVREIDPNMPISSVRTMEEFYYGSAVSAITAFIRVVAGIGTMGMVLAMVGLYGLVSYAAARRMREIGIRMAIGAKPGSVLRMVLRHALLLAAGGIAIGLVGSVATGNLIRATVPSAQGMDLIAYVMVVPALLAITVVAAYAPARRAARVDPVVALRSE